MCVCLQEIVAGVMVVTTERKHIKNDAVVLEETLFVLVKVTASPISTPNPKDKQKCTILPNCSLFLPLLIFFSTLCL